ncbi:MAG: hypothetical protein ACFFG0_53840 [Candidatus Thorarchaeota archaeon]
MMNIQTKDDYHMVNDEPQCSSCGDLRKVYIYRNDWEDFDETDCKSCNMSTK